MKGYTSRERFDERRRFTAVNEEMGRVRLDADANEQARLVRTDARRRSADVAEGSPDDGFRICETHLIDPIRSLDGWSGETLQAFDEREISTEIGLARRDPETLPHVVRVRGYTEVIRQPDQPIDLLRLPLAPYGQPGPTSYAAAAVIMPVKFLRPPTDDEIVNIQAVVLDANGDRHVIGPSIPGGAVTSDWMRIRLPLSELDNLPRSPDDQGNPRLILRGWGLTDLPPRAEIFFDGLEAEDGGLGENDFVVRGGSSTLEGAGRMYVNGWRVFIESDWRYRRQPYLPDSPALQRPADWQRQTHLVYLDLWERTIHAFQDEFLREPALDGEDTAFRTHKISQIRIQLLAAGQAPALPTPTGAGLLSTNIAQGNLPDRYPPEKFDPCRDRCLFTENVSTGEGYRGTDNLHVRLEIIGGGPNPIFAWSRNNAATVAPLRKDADDDALSVFVASEQTAYFHAGDIVVLEDELTRLDAERYPPILRQLRAVDTSSGRLEFQPEGHTLPEPALLAVGGGLPRGLRRQDRAAVRRWDGVDRLVGDVRYNLADGITFAFSGEDFRINEYWTFTARINHPEGAAFGTVDTLIREPVHGPRHERVPLARIRWNDTGREIEDLRLHFLPLHEVRQRLVELGRRRLAPGAFTVVVGDGERTFGDFDQNLAENVTGDEVLQAALDRLGFNGGTIYVRAGSYKLEHSVLVQGRSKVRIMGDGDATELVVWGAGGAFYLDRCGLDGQVSLENMRLIEKEGEHTPSGAGGLPGLGRTLETIAVDGSVRSATRLTPADLTSSGGSLVELVDNLAQAVAKLRPGLGRTAASVVQTLIELRRLQRLKPGQPLEDVAPELLEVLQRLPHGVVTISDSNQVNLNQLNLNAIGRYTADGIEAPGILLTGQCRNISVRCCRIDSPAGVVAAGYGRFLTPRP